MNLSKDAFGAGDHIEVEVLIIGSGAGGSCRRAAERDLISFMVRFLAGYSGGDDEVAAGKTQTIQGPGEGNADDERKCHAEGPCFWRREQAGDHGLMAFSWAMRSAILWSRTRSSSSFSWAACCSVFC